MPIDEIVDISQTRLKRRRQLRASVGVPLLGVVLVILSILGVTLYTYEASRQSALDLTHDVLNTLQARIAHEVDNYLAPATRAALIARDMVARNAIPDGRAAMEAYASSMLRQVPNLAGFFIGTSDGDFMMVRRDPQRGTDTKLIWHDTGGRHVASVHLDEAGNPIDHTLVPGDDFDPRTRDWYTGALRTRGVYWSQPYVFFTTQTPGITASIHYGEPGAAAPGSGPEQRVFGVDITLEELSKFLTSLHIGQTGRAAIVGRDGQVIAAPEMARPARAKARSANKATQGALADPALQAAYDRFRVQGYGNRTLTIHGKRYVTIASRLPAAGEDWVLLIAAPERDFTRFAGTNGRRHLLLSLITIALASLLGVMLIRQNRRADRMARRLRRQQEIGVNEGRALSALAVQPGLFDPGRPLPALSETLAEMNGAQRVSVWRLAGDGLILHCEDLFDRRQGSHTGGLELARSEAPGFFDSLGAGKPITVADAGRDARTADVHRLLMRSFGSRSLSVLPVRGQEGVNGALLLEDADVGEPARNFNAAVTGIAAIRMRDPEEVEERHVGRRARTQAGDPDAEDPEAPGPAAGARHAPEDAPGRFSPVLAHGDGERRDLAASVYPRVAAMVLRFDDAVVLNTRDADAMGGVADEIARAMQELATRFELPYMKLTGHHLVAAAGCTESPDPTAALRLADAALAAREACLALLSRSDLDPVFRIGMDFGAALGSALGQQPRLFNLWGDVIHTAELMAQSATEPGSIQVSEGAYEALNRQFLFRPRGMFYVPRIGTARTFILAGRR
ncbi:cache domain-containing protein [Lichenicoccus sp.]|uniref:cache domain-containing protein n=1 Tax=Lichenicoccus sp. TaxID=2781899 RepID=UPI003D1324A1